MKTQIPAINRDGSLITRLIPVILVGADKGLDRESKLYISLLVRLIDKAFTEYMEAKEYIEEELKIDDKLAYRFHIINHLENCLNAISRAVKVFNVIVGKKYKEKTMKKNFNILNFVSQKTIKEVKKFKVSDIRNRVEHIEEDIYFNKFKADLFVDVDDKYQKICINNQCISLFELVQIIENYHNFVLEIFSNLPNQIEK